MRTSLEKFVTLIELTALICLVILGERDFVGMVSVESITLWSDIGEKVWSTEWIRVEAKRARVMGWKRDVLSEIKGVQKVEERSYVWGSRLVNM